MGKYFKTSARFSNRFFYKKLRPRDLPFKVVPEKNRQSTYMDGILSPKLELLIGCKTLSAGTMGTVLTANSQITNNQIFSLYAESFYENVNSFTCKASNIS